MGMFIGKDEDSEVETEVKTNVDIPEAFQNSVTTLLKGASKPMLGYIREKVFECEDKMRQETMGKKPKVFTDDVEEIDETEAEVED